MRWRVDAVDAVEEVDEVERGDEVDREEGVDAVDGVDESWNGKRVGSVRIGAPPVVASASSSAARMRWAVDARSRYPGSPGAARTRAERGLNGGWGVERLRGGAQGESSASITAR